MPLLHQVLHLDALGPHPRRLRLLPSQVRPSPVLSGGMPINILWDKDLPYKKLLLYIQGDPSGRKEPPPVDLNLGCSAIASGQLVAAVAAHLSPKSPNPSH